MLPALRGPAPGVLMAGLDVLDRCPRLSGEARPLLIETIQDPSSDVAYWAIRLAGKLRAAA